MPQLTGRYLRLSPARRFIGDLVHFAKQVPTVPMERTMHLGPLVAARRAALPRPSWCAIFAKAYALVAASRPELRRAYIGFPRPRLYEHPANTACVAIARRLRDEEAVFFVRLRAPEHQPLEQLHQHLRRYQQAPPDSVAIFRRTLRLSRLPRPLRRFLWWFALNTSGLRRARCMGTFGVSVVASQGAAGLHLLSPLTTALNYGVFREDGSIDVRLTYDHRVLDGGPAARALVELERTLKGPILNELHGLCAFAAADAEAMAQSARDAAIIRSHP